ncbi:unnamed protein product [Adineta steineri]|uniref:Uncharacterized protein n=1 Tax=Adineta steineri TaxID=433720 RepID=A0A819Q8H0_9BILA|nr:unnamed protein product [Adineta steineri]CAF4024454.1 unnamed protein product [Adineta steineri]
MTLNMFENVDKPNPPDEELNVQRKWTRAYIVVLIVIMASVIYITMLSYQTVTTIVDKPTLDEYANLPKSADCLCTNLSIPYHTFINFNPQFHEICKSHFIELNGEWMSLLYDSYKYQRFNKRNLRTFQRMALFHFQAIQAMCRMAVMAVNNELTLFLNSTLTTVEILEPDLFENKINTTINNFCLNTMRSTFLYPLQLIRNMYSGNGLISAIGTNWYPVIAFEATIGTIYMQAQKYNLSSCNCATMPACVEPISLELNSGSNWIVPGMMIGCLPLESMLESTLECIYDQDCLDTISETLLAKSILSLSSARTRFKPINTTKLITTASELFIEDWGVKFSYEKYFASCQPKTCSYVSSERFHIINSMSTILTIYGGICILLQFIIPIGFKFAYKCFSRRNRQITAMDTT